MDLELITWEGDEPSIEEAIGVFVREYEDWMAGLATTGPILDVAPDSTPVVASARD